MQHTPHRCPHCYLPLRMHSDMWGPYYRCEHCGWTAEDEERMVPAGRTRTRARALGPFDELALDESLRGWEMRRHPR